MFQLGSYRYAFVKTLDVDRFSFKIIISHNAYGLFEIILHLTCEYIHRFLRVHGIDDRTSSLVLTGIAKVQ